MNSEANRYFINPFKRLCPFGKDKGTLKILTHETGDSDDAKAVEILQKGFADLEDVEGLRALAALRSSRTLGEEVMD